MNFSYPTQVKESQGYVYVYGYNSYNNAYNADIFLRKYTLDGNPGSCASDSFSFQQTINNLTVTDLPMLTIAGSAFLPLSLSMVDFDYSLQQNSFLCGSITGCDSLGISGPTAVCDSVNTYTFFSNRNAGCHAPVSWTITPSLHQVVQKNDSLITIRFLQTANYKIKAKLNTGCAVLEDSLQIAVQISPALNLGPDSSLCPNNSLLLNAHTGFSSYTWQDNSTDSTFLITGPGTYFVTALTPCGTAFRDTVVITAAPPIPFDLGPNLSKCNNDSLTITAPAGFINYSWTPNYNSSATSGQTIIVFPSVDTMYRCAAEKTPGCFAYDSIRITVHYSPQINLGADTSLCSGNSLQLNAGNGFQQYLWSTGLTTQQITAQSAGNYSVIGTDNNNCKSYDTLKILNVYNNPVINLPKDSLICAGSGQNLNAGPGFVNYLWSTGNISQTLTVNVIGNYWVSVTDNHGCKGSDTTKITTIIPLPANFLPADTSIWSYGTLQLKPLSLFTSYLWSNGATTNAIQISQPGIYWLQVKNNFDCTGKDTVIVNPKQCLEGFYIPSAFTPNRDGKNDVFRPLLFGKIIKFKFTIYNRWGNKVFETNVLQKGWDGKVDGKETDTNVFVWLCTYQFEGQGEKVEKGTVVLIR